MTYKEVREAIEAALTAVDEWTTAGVRFEDLDREIGDLCENSRHNPDRDDSRDFPEYGTDEYCELDELDGTSAWSPDYERAWKLPWKSDSDEIVVLFDHCYIIAGDCGSGRDDMDAGEVIIKNARVVSRVF